MPSTLRDTFEMKSLSCITKINSSHSVDQWDKSEGNQMCERPFFHLSRQHAHVAFTAMYVYIGCFHLSLSLARCR